MLAVAHGSHSVSRGHLFERIFAGNFRVIHVFDVTQQRGRSRACCNYLPVGAGTSQLLSNPAETLDFGDSPKSTSVRISALHHSITPDRGCVLQKRLFSF
ncbi:hypothetical protein Baya_9885 [Bagarius yarrelli]|uniref:Uncharacterized protein n=1 Tax=Bagarius yarrelli TaxID=175774 RepID=A0A556U8W8_BAGYA|nr:hypothetical protein Baya_9885 [Bagarius yarrelli]